jgi:hypothetical protein
MDRRSLAALAATALAAKSSVNGLDVLKSLSPTNANADTSR